MQDAKESMSKYNIKMETIHIGGVQRGRHVYGKCPGKSHEIGSILL